MLQAAPSTLRDNWKTDASGVCELANEYNEYLNRRGVFSVDILNRSKSMAAHEWWQMHGSGTPTLKWLATRALSQPVSASCSEQAWSEYDHVHNKKRNRLEKAKASELVKGHNQASMYRSWYACTDVLLYIDVLMYQCELIDILVY